MLHIFENLLPLVIAIKGNLDEALVERVIVNISFSVAK